MKLIDNIKLVMKTHDEVIERVIENDDLIYEIERASLIIIDSLNAGGAVFTFGNGGSAADAQHMAAELVGRFALERNGFRAIALTTDSSTISSLANDYGYDRVFARQIEALGRPGDVAVAFSTSGKSPNIINAAKTAKSMDMKIIGFTGASGGPLGRLCDSPIVVPSDHTPRIQEAHVLIYHIICELVEKTLSNRRENS